MLPESNPKKSCRGSHHALRLHRNLLQSQAPPLSARLSLPTRVRKTLEQSNKPTKLNNCLSAFSKTDHFEPQSYLRWTSTPPEIVCLIVGFARIACGKPVSTRLMSSSRLI